MQQIIEFVLVALLIITSLMACLSLGLLGAMYGAYAGRVGALFGALFVGVLVGAAAHFAFTDGRYGDYFEYAPLAATVAFAIGFAPGLLYFRHLTRYRGRD